MSIWIQWKYHAEQIISLLRSVWYANLDGLGRNWEYMCDDSNKHQQPNESDQSNQPYESQQRNITKRVKYYDDIGYRDTTTISGSISELEHDLLNVRLNSPTINIDYIHN
jgi:hypothetical protein